MPEHESLLSDALLRQLIAVGQVDILVGLPTLNNAATIVDVVRAVNACFTTDFLRQRTVLIHSDGGSSDGTPELIRGALTNDADIVQTSHSLRTLHRVLEPYHGLPGKHTALRSVLAAGDLTQARVVVVLDPSGPSTTAARVTELIRPIASGRVEFLAPRYRRHPRDGTLVTQLARPLVDAVYGVALDEPLGAEFSCSGAFASHCLEQDMWNRDAARFAIDLWLRTEAIAGQFMVGQIWRPATTAAGTRTTLREAVAQVVVSLIECLRAHHTFWLKTTAIAPLPNWGVDPGTIPEAPVWDYAALAEQACHDLVEIRPLLQEVVDTDTLAHITRFTQDAVPRFDDELWVRIVYAFAVATHDGRMGVEHLSAMFTPLYMWRASAFMAATASESPEATQTRLDALCDTFQRLKPALVAGWSADMRSR
jgi:hypothetical protein